MATPDIVSTIVPSGSTNLQGVAAGGGLRLMGISATENAAGTARIHVYHGTDNTGPEILDIQLSASQSMREWFAPVGIPVPNGLYIERSGTSKVTFFTLQRPAP
jgi:hypothetical protein